MKRKTSITKIASILTVLAMVWGGVACQPEAPVEPTKYTISFDSGVESITVEEGTVAKEPTTAPEKTGYTFGGWLNGEAAYDWTKPVTSNLSLTAKWTPTEYTITYLPEGVETDNPTTYTIETETIVLDTNPTSPDATKPKFVAWHVVSEEGDVVTEIAEGSTGNKTFYAEFSAEEPCVVKFMLGTEVVTSFNVKKDTKITLPTGFEKYSLFSDADCTTAFDTTTAITADTTIYLKLKTFTISYKVLPFNEEGSLSDIPYGTVFTDEEINALAEEIDGYTYKGIFTDEACTVQFDNTNEITSDLTVYVLYVEEPCVVKFMLGTEEVKSINVKKDTKITLPTDLEKYNLFSDADCTTAFDTTTAITEDTTIYVKLKTFTISYKVLPFDNVNPVEGETNGSISVEYGTVFTDEKINELAVEIDGYTYKDIFTDEACTVLFDNTKAITSDLTVYVLYVEEPCVVKFMLGTTEEASTKVKKGDKITLPTGFEKYNLFSDEDCTTAFDTTTAITADTTIYLKLKTFIISYKVLPFDKVNPVEGETNGSMPVEYGTVFTNEEINAFAEEIPGYTYKGIFTDEACKVLFDNTNEITSDLTVYVLYEEVVEETVTQTWTPFGTLTLAENKWESEEGEKGNYQATLSVLPADYQAKTGDVIRIKLKGTSNKDLDNFQVCLIDNGENTNGQGSWGYVPISDYIPIAEKVVAGEAFDFTVDISVKKDSTQAGGSYCKISLQAGTWTSDDSESRVLTLDMPDVLSLDVKSLANGYGTIVSVNDDGSVTLKADGNAFGQAGIQLGGCQNLSVYSKLKIEYTASAQIQVKFGTEVNLYGAATTISFPAAVETKTLKEIDISEEDKAAIYSIMVGPNGDTSTTMTIYSITLEK